MRGWLPADRDEKEKGRQISLEEMKDTASKKYEQLFDDNELDVNADKGSNENATLKEVRNLFSFSSSYNALHLKHVAS